MFNRLKFYKKYLGFFEKEFSAEDFENLKTLFTLEMCYNAGYVLAQELSTRVVEKSSKVVFVAPDGVAQELRSHGFTNLDTLEDTS